MQITVKNMEKVYGQKKALSDISFAINRAGVYLVAGHNGSGKTTMLEILAGMNFATSGAVTTNGKIATLFQENSLRHNAKVMEEIRFYQKVFSTPQSYIDELIDYLKLSKYLNKKTGQLSIGTQRRCLVLLMLMNHQADILLLDEPCSGLDVESRKVIWWVLGKLKKDKIILVSDHYLNESSKQTKEVIFLHDGRLVAHAPIEEFLKEFKYNYITPTFQGLVYDANETELVVNDFGEYVFSPTVLDEMSTPITLEDMYVYINRNNKDAHTHLKEDK